MPKPVAENAETISKLTLQLMSPASVQTGDGASSLFGEMLTRSRSDIAKRDIKEVAKVERADKPERPEETAISDFPVQAQRTQQAARHDLVQQPREVESPVATENAQTPAVEERPAATEERPSHDDEATAKTDAVIADEPVAREQIDQQQDAEPSAEVVETDEIAPPTEESATLIDDTEQAIAAPVETELPADEVVVADETVVADDAVVANPLSDDTIADEKAAALPAEPAVQTEGDAAEVAKTAETLNTAETTEATEAAEAVEVIDDEAAVETAAPAETTTLETEAADAAAEVVTAAGAQQPKSEQTGMSTTDEEASDDISIAADEEVQPERAEEKSHDRTVATTAEESVDSESIEDENGFSDVPEAEIVDTAEETLTTDGEKAASNIGESAKLAATSTKAVDKTPVAETNRNAAKVELAAQTESKTEQARHSEAPKSTVRMANQQAMINRIASNVKLMVGRKQSSIRMDLDPPELGKMHVRLSVKDAGLTGHLRVESIEAKELITRNLDTLKNALEKEGLAITDFQVDVDSSRRDNHWQNQYRDNQDTADNTPGSLPITEAPIALHEEIMTKDRLNLIV